MKLLLLNRYRTGSVSDVMVEELLQKFTYKIEETQRRNLTLTVETQDTTKAEQLPGVELEISHGFGNAPEPGRARTGITDEAGMYTLKLEPDEGHNLFIIAKKEGFQSIKPSIIYDMDEGESQKILLSMSPILRVRTQQTTETQLF